MKNIIESFYNDIKKSREICPWAKEQTLSNFIQELESEINEMKAAIGKNDDDNLKEELGDVFWDTLFLLATAEQEKGFDIKDTISKAHQKLLRRKPHVFGDATAETAEDAKKLWKEAKEREKGI